MPMRRGTVFLKNLISGRLVNRVAYRGLLSPAYQCSHVWEQRLRSPLFKGIDLDDFFMEMDKKFKAKKKVTALDIDLFVNGITTDDRSEELGYILQKFRQTRSTVRTLNSTHHALVRLMVKNNQEDILLDILSNRIKYGIFPDNFAMNILMDAFIEKNNYKDASRVASLLMLQEQLDYPLSSILALYACHMHLREENPQPWHDTAPVAQEDDDEEELVRVPYLRNPHFDDHFDLVLREHLLGKTLYYSGKALKDQVGRSYMAVGLALYEKWSCLENLLDQFLQQKQSLLKDAVIQIETIMQKTGESPKEGEENKELQSNKSSLNSHDRVKEKFSSLEKAGLVAEGDLHALVCEKIKDIKKLEEQDIKSMTSLFQEWEVARESELQREMTLISLKESQATIEAKKKELGLKEQHLFFFENEEKHMLEVAEIDKEETEKPKQLVHEEEYIPPELPRKPRNDQYVPQS